MLVLLLPLRCYAYVADTCRNQQHAHKQISINQKHLPDCQCFGRIASLRSTTHHLTLPLPPSSQQLPFASWFTPMSVWDFHRNTGN